MGGCTLTDAELLLALRDDPQRIGEIYDRYARRLVQYLRRSGANEEVAWDAVQETFARLTVSHRRVRPAADGSLWPWLTTVGQNLVRDWQRRGAVESRARRRLGLPVVEDEAAGVVSRVDADRLRPSLRLALDRLTPEQQSAVTARVLDEHDYPQIAETTGASEQTIRRRVSRGLRAMQTFLQGGNS